MRCATTNTELQKPKISRTQNRKQLKFTIPITQIKKSHKEKWEEENPEPEKREHERQTNGGLRAAGYERRYERRYERLQSEFESERGRSFRVSLRVREGGVLEWERAEC